MLQDILNKTAHENESYSVTFDFAEVEVIQPNGLLRCRLLQRLGAYDDCLILGESYSPKPTDKGLMIFVGKQKYPCFFAFSSGGSSTSNQSGGEVNYETLPPSGELTLSYRAITQNAIDDLELNKAGWSSQVTLQQILDAYDRNAKSYGTDPNFFIAQTKAESTFTNAGFEGTNASPTGVKGWSQFTEETATFVGLQDRSNILQNIDAQYKYMFMLYNGEAKGDIVDALGRYNRGWNWRNIDESRKYVPYVISIYNRYIK